MTCFSYDLRDNLKSLRDARGQTTLFDYDELNRPTRSENELIQTLTPSLGGANLAVVRFSKRVPKR